MPNTQRTINRNRVYVPDFMDYIAAQQRDVELAKQRVSFAGGVYQYTPSKEYLQHRFRVRK